METAGEKGRLFLVLTMTVILTSCATANDFESLSRQHGEPTWLKEKRLGAYEQ